MGHGGKVPFTRVRGKPFDKALCELGECIHYKIPKKYIGPDLNKWDDRWGHGIFLGIRPISNEVYVGTAEGVVKCRTIRRRVPDSRWNPELLKCVQGVPWEMSPSSDLPSEQQLQPLPSSEQMQPPEVDDDSKHVRHFKIFRKDILRRQAEHGDGFTPNCPGCAAARRGTIPKNHSPACRARYRGILLQDDRAKLRVEAADSRVSVSKDQGPNIVKPNAVQDKKTTNSNESVIPNAPSAPSVPSARLPQSIPFWPPDVPALEDPYLLDDDAAELFMSDDEGDQCGGEEDLSMRLIATIASEYIKFGVHVSEVFSPPRATKLAAKVGLHPGFALDLTQSDSDGSVWDFSKKEKRDRAEDLVK